jgi:hypothetical protein
MNWAIPCAPAGERANGLKFRLGVELAEIRAAETFHRCAARAIAGANLGGTKSGIAQTPVRTGGAMPPVSGDAGGHPPDGADRHAELG